MNIKRQNAWTIKEDEFLASTILDYITKGDTQLNAFKHVSDKLGRSTSACAFRWNSTVRREYSNEIKKARNKELDIVDYNTFEENDIKFENALVLLKEWKAENKDYKRENEHLRNEIKSLQDKLSDYENRWENIVKLSPIG